MSARFGILGPGKIAASFVGDLEHASGATAVAVGSRSPEHARSFAEQHGIPRWHDDYDALVADPDVDIIYVATPHAFHKEHSLLALRAGKAILCEKPIALNRGDAAAIFVEAERRGLFAMEAMWTRFIPACVRAKEMIDSGALGTPHWLQADFGFPAPHDPASRLLDPALGGGALLDIGIYPVTLARWLLGPVDEMRATGVLLPTGVDGSVAIALRHASGAVSALSCSFLTGTPTEATISGPDAVLRLTAPFHHSRRLIYRKGYHDQPIELDHPGSGYQFEADEVARCLAAGRTQSARMPWADSLEIMGLLDKIRAAIGVRYAADDP